MKLSELPSIHLLLADPRLQGLPHDPVREAARAEVEAARQALRRGEPAPVDLVPAIALRVTAMRAPHLRRVINATGVAIHTNLGRAPLAPEAQQAVAQVAAGYCNLEMVLDSGQRGGRLDGVRSLLQAATGAADALAVNNNAAAVLLVLTALAAGREVIVSRGELVEIGGSFRVPEVIAAGGARLVEVGATNRTRISDYERVIGPDTALLLRVHPSNFRMLGFTGRPARAELVALGRAHGIPVVEDLGSGLIGALPPAARAQLGLDGPEEGEAVDRALAQGVDLACFSGDKLLGGPQAGIIAGQAALVARLRSHPLYRALRLDKLVLAALEATLRLYAEGRSEELPIRRFLGQSRTDAERVARRIAQALPGARVEDDLGFSGGGALPAIGLPGRVVALERAHPELLATRLRQGRPAVVARVARGCLILDPRCLLPGEVDELISAVQDALVGADPAADETARGS